MIELTKLDGSILTLNCDLIESVETSHDSTITMLNGKKYIVKEDFNEIIKKTIAFKQKCFRNTHNIKSIQA